MESDDENILVSNSVNNDERNASANRVQGHGNKVRNFKLEPALIFIFFGWNLADSIIPNQLLQQTCLAYGFNVSDCAQINGNNATKEIEETIQPHVAEIMMASSLLNSIIPAVMSLFIGPWTDKFGRKKVICATFFGFSVTLASLCTVSFISDHEVMIDPWTYVYAYIPIIATGGWPTMIVAILCYVTDLTDEVNRSSRLVVIETLIFFGVLLGGASSSYVLSMTSPTTVFLISTVCVTLGSIYTLIVVDESVQAIENVGACRQIRELISPAPVKEMLRTCFKKRSFKERRILWCLIMILMFTVFTMNGTGNVSYLFVREKFNWTIKEATLYNSASMLISIIAGILGLLVLKKLLKFSDISLVFLGLISTLVDSIIKATAQTSSAMYFSTGISLFRILVPPMCRSLIATVIPNNEIGKVFSVASSFEAVSSLVASPLYTFVYENTFTVFAGAFFLITTGVYAISLILAYCVYRMKRTREGLINPYAQIIS